MKDHTQTKYNYTNNKGYITHNEYENKTIPKIIQNLYMYTTDCGHMNCLFKYKLH
jgi:hypothetical protein